MTPKLPQSRRSHHRQKRTATVFGIILGGLGLAAVGLYFRFLYAPTPKEPLLTAAVVKSSFTVEGHERSYTAVIPCNLLADAPLLFMFHGSNEDAQGIRRATGYAFDTLAEKEGFIVVYPDGYKGNWNDCRTAADYPARTENIDEKGMIRGLITRFHNAYKIDTSRVFAIGYSNGGQLVFRIAAELAEDFAGVAAIAATQPTADNFSCTPSGQPLPVLLISGTKDPIVPCNGGVISLFGFQPRGTALAAPDTARYFAELNGITALPEQETLATVSSAPTLPSKRTSVTVTRYRQVDKKPVIAYTVVGGGHVVPGPTSSFPRVVGKIDRDFDAPAVIWQFFAQFPVTRDNG